MYRKISLLVLLMLFCVFPSCKTQATENDLAENNNFKKNINEINQTKTLNDSPDKVSLQMPKIEYRDISNSRGLIEITDKGFVKGEIVRFYNQDGSLWDGFSLFDEYDDGKAYEKIKQNQDFSPFRSDPESHHFYFDWVGEDKLFYQAVVNEETKLKKFIKKTDHHFKTVSWEQYVLDCFAVEFDRGKNPLRKAIDGEILKQNLDENLSFKPKEVSGDWLKIESFDINDVNDKNLSESGWIKWKDENKIIINFFEDA